LVCAFIPYTTFWRLLELVADFLRPSPADCLRKWRPWKTRRTRHIPGAVGPSDCSVDGKRNVPSRWNNYLGPYCFDVYLSISVSSAGQSFGPWFPVLACTEYLVDRLYRSPLHYPLLFFSFQRTAVIWLLLSVHSTGKPAIVRKSCMPVRDGGQRRFC